jgi:hypothetical protein
MKWILAIVVMLAVVGCSGLQRDYVPPPSRQGDALASGA